MSRHRKVELQKVREHVVALAKTGMDSKGIREIIAQMFGR